MPEVTPGPVALAVDVGGTKVEAALVDADGQILDHSRHRHPTGRDASSDQLAAAVVDVAHRALSALPAGASLLGAGIGSAGPIDQAEGTVSPVNILAWRGFALRDLVRSVLSDHVEHPTVILATDGLAITLAEHWVGAGKGVDNMMGMVISTGVGGGLILGGRPKHGASGNAGHIGHIEVSAMDGESTFGHPGTLEAVASGPPFGRVGATSRLGRDHRRRAFTRLRAWRRNSSRRHHPGGHRRWAGDLQRGRSAGSGAGRDRRRILPSHA